jgi:SAM-dependent methyltransferase
MTAEQHPHELYRTYAPVYDATGQAWFGARLAAWTLDWLGARGERPARVLDLACGTGAATLVFAAAGCRTVGLDRAPAMLAIARARARDAGVRAAFVQADMRALPRHDQRRRTGDGGRRTSDGAAADQAPALQRSSARFALRPWSECAGSAIRPGSFDLASCFYDSLNYLTAERDLERVLAGVRAALRLGGYLVCDLNTEAEYQTWDDRDTVVYDGRDHLVYNQLRYDPERRLTEGRIVWFVRELERWWRGEEVHIQRAWTEAELRGAFAQAGLAVVERLGPDGGPATAASPRVVWVVRKT